MLVNDQTSTVYSSLGSLSLALHQYIISPEEGLLSLKDTIPSLRNQAKVLLDDTSFFSRLDLLEQALHLAIESGCVYDPEFHQALFEVADAFEQVLFASSLGGDYVTQTLFLLDRQRDCWQVLETTLSHPSFQPVFLYCGYLTLPSSKTLEDILSALSQIGEVSFHLQQKAKISAPPHRSADGRIELKTAQPLAWLQAQYPYVDWQVLHREPSYQPGDSLGGLASTAFSSMFLSKALPKKPHYELLDGLGQWIRGKQYRAFAECFSPDGFLGRIEMASKRVPVSEGFQDIAIENVSLSAVPIRISGAFFACFQGSSSAGLRLCDQSNGVSSVSEPPIYLGRDVLSSALYIIEVETGTYAFDQSDCLGCYSLDRDAFFQTDLEGSDWWCSVGGDKVAMLVPWSLPITEKASSFDPGCLSLHNQALIVSQGGSLYALLYADLTVSEGVCGYSTSSTPIVKNLWFTIYDETFKEPWLYVPESVQDTCLPKIIVESEEKRRTGFYLVSMGDVSFWIEAMLILDILPFDSNKRAGQFVVYGVQYFHRFIYGMNMGKKQFSLLVDDAGGFVLEVGECVWRCDVALNALETLNAFETLECVRDVDGNIGLRQDNKKDIIINKENIARFVAYFWPTASLLKV